MESSDSYTSGEDPSEYDENEEEDDDASESITEENNDMDIDNGDQKLGKDLAVHLSNGTQKQLEDLLLHISTGKLDKAGRKVLGNGIIKVIEQLVKENTDSIKRSKKGLLEEIMNMPKQVTEDVMVFQANQRFSCNRGYRNFQFTANEMIQRFWPGSRGLLTDTEIKELERKWAEQELIEAEATFKHLGQELERKWAEQELIEAEATFKHLGLLQEELKLKLAKLRPTAK